MTFIAELENSVMEILLKHIFRTVNFVVEIVVENKLQYEYTSRALFLPVYLL